MEFRVIQRGVLAGLFAGILSFVFTRIFVEPIIDQAINYESGRGNILNALRQAAGLALEDEGPDIFSRTIQSTVGVATGLIGMSIAFGALVAVAFLILHGRVAMRPWALAALVGVCGFLGLFLLPYGKYPANPPAIGHDFTIVDRGRLYLTMVAISLTLVIVAALVGHRLAPRLGAFRAALVVIAGGLVLYGVALAVLPSLGDLSANVAAANDLGFARAATETPQPITNTLGRALTVDGVTYAPGQIVYPGFDADLLWKFRWYALINQIIIWTGITLVFGSQIDRLLRNRPADPKSSQRLPAGV